MEQVSLVAQIVCAFVPCVACIELTRVVCLLCWVECSKCESPLAAVQPQAWLGEVCKSCHDVVIMLAGTGANRQRFIMGKHVNMCTAQYSKICPVTKAGDIVTHIKDDDGCEECNTTSDYLLVRKAFDNAQKNLKTMHKELLSVQAKNNDMALQIMAMLNPHPLPPSHVAYHGEGAPIQAQVPSSHLSFDEDPSIQE